VHILKNLKKSKQFDGILAAAQAIVKQMMAVGIAEFPKNTFRCYNKQLSFITHPKDWGEQESQILYRMNPHRRRSLVGSDHRHQDQHRYQWGQRYQGYVSEGQQSQLLLRELHIFLFSLYSLVFYFFSLSSLPQKRHL